MRRRDADEQSARGLRIEGEDAQLVVDIVGDTHPVIREEVRLVALETPEARSVRVLARTRQQWHRTHRDADAHSGLLRHLIRVTREAEAGDVGRRVCS